MTTTEYFQKGVTYAEYMNAFERAVAAGRTSGPIQTPDYIHYTLLNLTRMKRLYKHTELQPGLVEAWRSSGKPLKVICLTEFWCGDAAQNIPVIQLLAEQVPGFDVRYLFRDENTELMDRFVTNGGRSIPKFILADGEGNVITSWGPRPAAAQELMLRLKQENASIQEAVEALQHWYHRDKTVSLQQEWKTLASVPH